MKNSVTKSLMALWVSVHTSLVMAQGAAQVSSKVEKTASSILGVLNAVSVVIITIAFIFSGYQLAFNNKRFNDIAPVLIGGLVVGAANLLAQMLVNSPAS